ncbi:MAG: anti-sigma factor family protein [Gemmatimonadaceae bacterium]
MQHLDEGTIHAWLDGALSPEEAARANAHVEGCAQCQAAVAEARGFIAASSRILTALDDAPRGVIPIARTQRVQPWVWRVAATVLVVATGTVLLVKERGSESRSATSNTSDSSARSLEVAPGPVTILSRQPAAADSPGARATAQLAPAQPATAPEIRAAAPVGTQADEQHRAGGVTPPPVRATSKQDLRLDDGGARASADVRRLNAPAESKSDVVEPVAPARVPAAAAAPAPLRQAFGTIGGGAVETVPREVASKRVVGGTQTFYEIAPGDTVMLEEQTSPQLQSVVTALGTQAQPARRAEKAGATVESQQKTQPAPPPSVAALQDAQVGERHSISWLDPSTRGVIVLSGRHSQEELERIREQIQRLRAVRSKRNPE